MRIVPELDHKIRREIRNELALKPIITITGLKERIKGMLLPRGY